MEDERGPGLEFLFVFCVWQSSVRGCRFSFVFVYLIKCVLNVRRFPPPSSRIYYLRYNHIIGEKNNLKSDHEHFKTTIYSQVGTRVRPFFSAHIQSFFFFSLDFFLWPFLNNNIMTNTRKKIRGIAIANVIPNGSICFSSPEETNQM